MTTGQTLVRVRRLEHIAVRRREPEQTAEWYSTVLGLERRLVGAFGPASPITVGAGDCSLSIFPGPKASFEHVAFEVAVDELASATAALEATGVAHRYTDHGIARSLYLIDPDGVTVELTAYTSEVPSS